MTLPFLTRPYETWAPFVGRLLMGAVFLVGASFKIPGTEGFTAEVGMAAAAGVPIATVAVFLAFILEVVAGVSIIVGWQTRLWAFLLMLFTVLLTAIFYRNLSDMMVFGMFMSHLGLIAGLLFISTYGAQSKAVTTCPLPQGMTKSV
ncbi:MAG: DoxX family protein [Candidatus Pacebacteria bacterium]|nr:DoxX family protein [Candidatus Paceibacterota bacterium]